MINKTGMADIDGTIYINEKKIVMSIFFMALILRLIVVMNLSPKYQALSADAFDYDKIAVNLSAGRGFIDSDTGLPVSFKAPLYPLFLALIYFLFGHSYFAVRVIQCILIALLCVIIFYTAKNIFGRKIGFISAIMLACYPPYIFYSYYGGPAFLLSENLCIPVFFLMALFIIKDFFVQSSTKNCIILGILMGIIALIRPFFALFPWFIFFPLLYKNKFLPALKKMLPLLAGFILVITPWAARNYFVHKAFIPFTTLGGFSLYCANNQLVQGGGLTDPKDLFTQEENVWLSKMPEVERDRIYGMRAKEFLYKNYKNIPKLFLKKILALWDPFDTNYSAGGRRAYNIWYSVILALSLFGITKAIKSKLNINTLLLLMFFLYISFITLIFAGEPRFRYPMEPCLIIFASLGISAIYGKFKNKFFPSALIGIIICINFIFYAYSDLLLGLVRSALKFIGA